MKNRIKGSAWSSQEPQRALRWGLLEVISSAHWRCPLPVLPITHPAFVCPGLPGERALCVCGFVPFITMQTIFGCSQGRSGIPALFPGFLLVHEKRKNNEEPVWLRLAKPWADGDVTRSPAVSGCSQTGHALSRHGVAIAWQPPHTSAPAAAQRLRGGSIQRPTKCQPSMKCEGISPRAQRGLPARTRAPARSSQLPGSRRGACLGLRI